MNYQITVAETKGMPEAVYQVTLTEASSGEEYSYSVVVEEEYVAALGWDNDSVNELIEHSFRFLLEREPPTSILKEFNLKVISKYFPEYEDIIRKD